MRARPQRLERLPEQYFTRAARARRGGGRARTASRSSISAAAIPTSPPPPHVVEALARAAARPDTHGYAPFAGLPALKEAIAARYRDVYGVEVDPAREVAVLPGLEDGADGVRAGDASSAASTIVLPDPGYPDYRSAVALAAAAHVPLPLLDDGRPDWDAAPREAAALYLNYPSNPIGRVRAGGRLRGGDRVGAARRRVGAARLRVRRSRLRRAPAGELPRGRTARARSGFELFSMSKSYGMAGWRLGFAVGNAELVARIEDLQNHVFAGVFMPVQEAGIAALTGPQESVEERRALYEARRDRALAALAGLDARGEGTFFVWFRLPDGRHVRAPARGAPRRASRRARASASAAAAGRGSRSRRRTTGSTSGSSGSGRRSEP